MNIRTWPEKDALTARITAPFAAMTHGELLAETEARLRVALSEDEDGNGHVAEPVALVDGILALFDRARAAGVIGPVVP
jgi:hypothetical protein